MPREGDHRRTVSAADRAALISGELRGRALIERLGSIPALERDAWADALLGIDEPAPADVPDLPRGAVPYVPSAVDEILATVREAPIGPESELVDLGSGLGRVVMLVHLLTGATARGVEIQEPLVARARQHAADLGLSAVSFVRANAAEIEHAGSVFYLHAPFNGAMLAQVLERLEVLASRRPIVLCAVGFELGHVAWLAPRASGCVSLTLYDSRRQDLTISQPDRSS